MTMIGNQAYGNDPLRPLSDLEGLLPKVDDLAQGLFIDSAQTKSLGECNLDTLKHYRDTALAVENLYANEDFRQLVKHVGLMIRVCERHVYHPAQTAEAKGAWFNQLSSLKSFNTLIEFFRTNNSKDFEKQIEAELNAIAVMENEEGDE